MNNEYEDEELTMQRHYIILGDNEEEPILAESNPKQVMVQKQTYSPQYFESLNQKFNCQPPENSKWKYHWQGPGSRCWCHKRLDQNEDICLLCQKEWEHWQLL